VYGKGIDFLFAPVFGCENYQGSWQPYSFEFLVKSVLKNISILSGSKDEF